MAKSFAPSKQGESLLRHWSLGSYAWWNNEITEGWTSRDSGAQARVFFDLLKPADTYFVACIAHDADESRTDRSFWYRAATFKAFFTVNRIVNEAFAERVLAFRAEDLAMSCARDEGMERTAMSAGDVNVNVNVIDP